MSDFLSNFTNDKYKKTVADHQDVASDVETTVSEVDTSSFEQTASETFEATTEVGNELSENEIDSNDLNFRIICFDIFWLAFSIISITQPLSTLVKGHLISNM